MISEDDALERALGLHPELQRWRDVDYERAESKSGVNWRLHLQLDAVVFRRASDNSLPDTRVIRELERRGESRAAAVHKIALLVTEELWERMKEASEVRASGKIAEAECDFEARNKELNDRIVALVGS